MRRRLQWRETALVLGASAVVTAAVLLAFPSKPLGAAEPLSRDQIYAACADRLVARPTDGWLQGCVEAMAPDPTPSATPSASPTVSPTGLPSSPPASTTPPGTSTPPTTSSPPEPLPGQSCPAYPAFPTEDCTGVPAGTLLTPYTGSCTITVPNTVIERKLVSCTLRVQAPGLMIRDSRINGSVLGPTNCQPLPSTCTAPDFTIADSEVIAAAATTQTEVNGVGQANFTLIRVTVSGGNRGVYCRFNCTIIDSVIGNQQIAQTPRIHASGIRQSQGATIIHSRIHCSAPDTSSGGGCSADLTGYGDFEAVRNNLIEKNLFVATVGGACAYGGSSGDDGAKPFGNQARDIRFIDNVFQRGRNRLCGSFFPITDFDSTRPGNVWSNNRWDDGGVVPPAN